MRNILILKSFYAVVFFKGLSKCYQCTRVPVKQCREIYISTDAGVVHGQLSVTCGVGRTDVGSTLTSHASPLTTHDGDLAFLQNQVRGIAEALYNMGVLPPSHDISGFSVLRKKC